MAAVLNCHLHEGNAEHRLKGCLLLAAVLFLRLAGSSLLAAEGAGEKRWLQVSTPPSLCLFTLSQFLLSVL